MRPPSFMLIAGETSGDLLAADLVNALREEMAAAPPAFSPDQQPLQSSLAPRFFGAGGPRMAAAGVELAFDLTAHSVIGLWEVVKKYWKFRQLFFRLYRLAVDQQPDAIICVDFSGFNRRFAHAIREHTRARRDWFHPWNPRIVQYVSPQVWASRPGRAYQMAEDYDLLLSIFPFEKEWYARRVPRFPVEFIGHPMLDRFAIATSTKASAKPCVLLLPGSRRGELARHLPVMLGALERLRRNLPDLAARMVLPNELLAQQAKQMGVPSGLAVQVGDLPDALRQATVAIASTGTVTMECALFGVPTVALYKTSWGTYQIGKRVVTVKFLAMPNLLADAPIFPEFIQDAATPENLACATLDLLQSPERREDIQRKLAAIVATLGTSGASRRAAQAVLRLAA
jgi:lipid-A-disaccharide synthase